MVAANGNGLTEVKWGMHNSSEFRVQSLEPEQHCKIRKLLALD